MIMLIYVKEKPYSVYKKKVCFQFNKENEMCYKFVKVWDNYKSRVNYIFKKLVEVMLILILCFK